MILYDKILDKFDDIIEWLCLAIFVFVGYFIELLFKHMSGSTIIFLIGIPIFVISIVASISCLRFFKSIRFYVLVPLAINIATPFLPSIVNKINYHYYKSDRVTIVEKIIRSKDYSESKFGSLDSPNANISDERIDIEIHGGKYYILFYTNLADQGALGLSYSAFLYVDDGGNPEMIDEMANIKPLDKNWYAVSYN